MTAEQPRREAEATISMATATSELRDPTFGLNRDKLRAELIALYHQYRSDAEQAASLQARYEVLMNNIITLLDEEFPGWNEPARPTGK